jgi:hypothetical protein
MHELGDNLQTVLQPQDPEGLLALACATATRAEQEQYIVISTTHGSKSEQATALQARMAKIVQSLGAIITDIASAAAERDTLLNAWGVGEETQGAQSNANGADAQTQKATATKENLSANHIQRALDTNLVSSLVSVGASKTEMLAGRGIRSLRDVLVAGEKHFSATPKVGPNVVDQVRAYAALKARDIPFESEPTAADIAAFCPTLRDVSMAALHYADISRFDAHVFGFDNRPVSVYDILHTPQEALIGDNNGNSTYARHYKLVRQGKYNELVRRAHKFAQEFAAAKTVQRH